MEEAIGGSFYCWTCENQWPANLLGCVLTQRSHFVKAASDVLAEVFGQNPPELSADVTSLDFALRAKL